MKYTKQVSVRGGWAKGSDVKSGTRCKIVNEVQKIESQFKNEDGTAKFQDVGQVRFEGKSEPLNVSFNKTSLNAFVEAFGEDSEKWQGNTMTVEVVRALVSGKMQNIMYFVPEGFKLGEDDNGYMVIVKKEDEIPVINVEEKAVNEEDLPF